MIIVSACLAGRNCRYSGDACTAPDIKELVGKGLALAVCPEELGGLIVPRPPAEIVGGDGADVLAGRAQVLNDKGDDLTANFLAGAGQTLAFARQNRVRRAILKPKSPSCGVGGIHDGTFSAKIRPGNGVAAELLRQHGVTVAAHRFNDRRSV